MGDKRNFAALDWVIGEISDTLKDARQALEAYVEDTKDSTRIRFCLTHIHQVHGSLQMVEFHGASLLAEEMEQLAQALMDNKVTSAPEAQEVLMRSLLQLPTYLEHVKAQKEDNPGIVLPLLNDLRAVRNQSYLSETNLFSPDLQLVRELYGSRHPITADKSKLLQVLKKLREMYQFAAASVLRGIKVEENLNYLDKVFSRMEALTQGTACYPLWEVSAALVEGLLRDDIELSVAVRGMLRHLARELRVLGEKAPAALDFMPRESLLKNLLYYVAKAESGGKKINRVKQRYKLSEALLDGVIIGEDSDSLSAPDPEAIRSVVVALNDEINTIKHALDLSLSGQGSPEDLKEVLPVVKRVADTLAVLGIGDLRKQVMFQVSELTRLSELNSFDEGSLLEVAGKIIEIEHRLDAIAKVVGSNRDLANVDEREIEIDQAKITVVKECQHGLEQAKDAIVEYISSKWDKSHLLNVGGLLHNIRGGLDMIPLPRPASILECCANYIQEQLLDNDAQPSWQALDTLADAIASVEYYLERLLGDMEEDTDSLLDVAESSVASLGYPLREKATASSEAALGSKANSVEGVSPKIEEFATTSVSEVGLPVADTRSASDTESRSNLAPPHEQLSQSSEVNFNSPEFQQEIADIELSVTSTPAVEPVAENTGVSLDQISLDDEGEESDIDDEIIEIFIEEAGEVQETLAEYFPQWKANQQDQDSLVVVRRAFHTLKGSGRMVEAFDIGELAWSIENMLNRIIDRTVSVGPSHSHIIELTLHVMPSLVEAFAHKRRNPQKALTEKYMAWAELMSEGSIPEELRALTVDGEVSLPDLAASNASVAQMPVSSSAEQAPEVEDDSVFDADSDENENLVLWEIFSSEAITHLATMDNFICQMEQDAPLYSPPSDDLQRALHTLKGSAKMAQVIPIAALAEPLESFAKELISYQVEINADILQLYRDAATYTREVLAQIAVQEEVHIARLDQFVARCVELRELAVGHLIRLKEMEKDGQQKVDPRLLSIFMAEEMNLLLDAEQILQKWRLNLGDNSQIDALVRELTTLEAGAQQANLPDMAGLSSQLRTVYEQNQAGQLEANEDFFVIVGAGHNALLDMVDAVAAGQNVIPPTEDITSALASLIHNGSLLPARGEVESPQAPSDSAENSLSLNEFSTSEPAVNDLTHTDLELFDGPEEHGEEELLGESEGLFESGEALLEESEEQEFSYGAPSDDGEWSEELVFDEVVADTRLNETSDAADSAFDGGAFELVDEDEVEDETLDRPTLDHASDSVVALSDSEPAPSVGGVEDDDSDAQGVGLGIEELSVEEISIDEVGIETSTFHVELDQNTLEENAPADDFLETVELVADQPAQIELDAEEDVEASTVMDSNASPSEGLQTTPEESLAHEGIAEPEVSLGLESIPGLLDDIDIEHEDYDEDILEVFLEEADELIEELDEAVHAWESDWSDLDNPEQIKRALHTLKGGARLAGMANLGELTHEYESYLIGSDLNDMDDVFFAKMHDYQDQVLSGVKGIKAFMSGGATASVIAAPKNASADSPHLQPEAAEPSATEVPASEQAGSTGGESNVLPFSPKVREDGELAPGEFNMPAVKQGGGQQAAVRKQAGPQEVIKVPSDLLEELVNLAGETSISRARIEQQVSDFGHALDDIDSTLARLQEQLRRLDIETEAQVLFRQEQMAAHEDFDPLEMDRYSQLQQLSRSLIESASDLVDLRGTLTDNIRDTETLLLQQSRINTTLQEGLMRSRMVPFSRLVPRLRRIVRQVAGELGKNVSFELDNIEGELDRSVLERMVPPLEHMLRNAVDHGIEMPERRIENSKPETGRIVLTLGREGGDVILRLADDGRGVDLRRVREKAIERGLMSSDSELSDFDIMQFILNAGFSTAETVTQISGRGVGMDVVSSEIKAMGGSVVINSEWGRGTEVVVRLPFTVSVNRALMVEIGQDLYAIPLNTIEGIVRVSPFELEHYYTSEDARFEYAGENYQVRYLGTLLNNDIRPHLEGHVLPLPVLLVRSADSTLAIQVDTLMGSREVVVKSLGAQFSAVQGLSGATLMGDGSVVVIIDPHALVRKEMARASYLEMHPSDALPAIEVAKVVVKTVMVVDDSVTVRKVTTRFLEREGFNVITAKDGVDALRTLQDNIPDIMLLDIEMPRMDGFEVAKNIRTSSRWKHIPIIMITSRTGDKHRDRAMDIGVNGYLGKPYQEDILLESLNGLLADVEKG